jgi:signal transduction histidine kinase/CheY-like chemotaxis protein
MQKPGPYSQPASETEAEDVNKIIRILLLVSLPLVALSVSRYFFEGWRPVFLLHITLVVLLALLNNTRGRIKLKTTALVLFYNVLGIGSLLTYQMWGFGGMGFVAGVLLCWLFFNKNLAILNILLVLILGIVYFAVIEQFPVRLDLIIRPLDVVIQFAALVFFLYPIISVMNDMRSRTVAAEAGLSEQIDRVKRAEAAKTSFLANMSHEIRTPLNAVLGALDLLEDPELTEAQKKYLNISRTAGESLVLVIDDILDMSRIEAGHVNIEPSWFSTNSLLQDVVDMFEFGRGKTDTVIELLVSPEVPRWLCGDADRIQQILRNLVGNALKFTEHGKISISVQKTGSGDTYRFTVTDTGIGIPDSSRNDVFDMFWRADSSLVRKHQGSGLGLSICKRLVDAMQGTIDFHSIEGEGSSFWFDLNLEGSDSVELPSRSEAADASARAAENRAQKSCRLLLAEDSEVNQDILQTYLELSGHQVDIAGNGIEALRMLEKSPYDAVLMDVSMPEMDGLEATRVLRASDGENRDIPVIALTAHVLSELREECLAAGMTEFVTKPVSRDQLLKSLDRVVLSD